MRVKNLITLLTLITACVFSNALFAQARSLEDIPLSLAATENVTEGQPAVLSINTGRLELQDQAFSFRAVIEYDESLLEFTGLNYQNAIVAEGATLSDNGRSIIVEYTSATAFSGENKLIGVNFTPKTSGNSLLFFTAFRYNDVAVGTHSDLSFTIAAVPHLEDVTLGLSAQGAEVGQAVNLRLNTGQLHDLFNVTSYSAHLVYDTTKLQYQGFDLTNALTQANPAVSQVSDGLTIEYTGQQLTGTGTLLNLEFNAIATGSVSLALSSFSYNTTAITNLPQTSITLTAPPVVTPIASIQANPAAYSDVIVEGIVTVGLGKLHATQAKVYVQDESGKGIQLFDYTPQSSWSTQLVRGNKVRVSGAVTQFNAVTEIADFTVEEVIATGQELPITTLTYAQATDFNTWEGTFAQLTGNLSEPPYYAGGGYNVNLVDADGNQLTARVWDTTGISVDLLTTGVPVLVNGIVDSYNGAAQLVPAYQDDISINSQVPFFLGVSVNPQSPAEETPFEVSADIIDNDGISSASVYWRLATQNWYLSPVAMSPERGVFTTIMPSVKAVIDSLNTNHGYYLESQDVYVKIQATDTDGNVRTSDEQLVEVIFAEFTNINLSFSGETDYPADYPFEKTVFTTDSILVSTVITNLNSQPQKVALNWRLENEKEFTEVLMEENAGSWQGWIPALDTVTQKLDNYVYYMQIVKTATSVKTSEQKLVKVGPRAPLVYNMALTSAPTNGQPLTATCKVVNMLGADWNPLVEFAYTVDYDDRLHYFEAVADSIANYWNATIPAQKAGSFVTVTAMAANEVGGTWCLTDDSENQLSYTWPVLKHTALLKVERHPFNPRAGEEIEIRFNSKQDDKAILRIYNAEGKLVHTPANELISYNATSDTYKNVYKWNGRDRNHRLVPIGLYIVHLETIDRASGKKKTATAPIVVGTRLD